LAQFGRSAPLVTCLVVAAACRGEGDSKPVNVTADASNRATDLAVAEPDIEFDAREAPQDSEQDTPPAEALR